MERRIYQQWPHENTFARSPQQLFRDMFKVRQLHRLGEEVFVPSVWVTLRSGETFKGWIWDLSAKDEDESASFLVEESGDVSRSADLVYFRLSEVVSVTFLKADEQGCQMPPFTVRRRRQGPELRQVDVNRKTNEFTRALVEHFARTISIKINWSGIEDSTHNLAAILEILNRTYVALYLLSKDDTFQKGFNKVNYVELRVGHQSGLQLQDSTLFVLLDLDEKEPTALSRQAIKDTLIQAFFHKQ